MVACLRLTRAHASAVVPGVAVDVGLVPAGGEGTPLALAVRNAGDEPLPFVLVRAALDATQVGTEGSTSLATTFALAEQGNYVPELECGPLGPGEARTLWMRWSPPPDARPGPRAWAVEALASPT